MRMSLILPPHSESYANHLAAMQMVNEPGILGQLELTAHCDQPHQLPPMELLKSLDDLDEEEDEDDEDEDVEDLDEEDDEDDLDEDFEDDEDDEEDDEEEEDDEDGGVKPLKMRK